jgi:glucose-1-phosphate cytidylyltransferase
MPWKITVLDTGQDTLTGGRLLRASKFINGDNFCMTYGDGVANLDISKTIKFHLQHKKMVTITGVRAPGRFGFLEIQKDEVTQFFEKPEQNSSWINGGFFVLNKKIFEYIDNDKSIWENEPLQKLSSEGQVKVWKHPDFWQPMDTLREKNLLEEAWNSGSPPWKLWND